jgi:uncharacterized membrane protein YpjA
MTKRFWQVAFLVSVLAIFVSINSLIPIFQSHQPYSSLQTAMVALGGLVLFISIIELLMYREGIAKKQYSMEALQPSGEVRTYYY